jgi:tRNA(fMet)-specific endonuclease VapC
MTHLLDTDICSAHMKRPGGLSHRFFQYSGGLVISSVKLGELFAGAYKLTQPMKLLSGIADLLQDVAVLDFDSIVAEQFGKLRGGLLQKGISVATADLMIASTALSYNLTLVTHTTVDYQHIPGLRLDDWLIP